MRLSAILILSAAACFWGCSRQSGQPGDANRPASQAAPAVPPKPYIEPNALFSELAAEFEPVREKAGDGVVDWSRGVLVASGSAKAPSAAPQERLKAQRGAEAAAVRNALLAASGIRVDSRGRYGDLRTGKIDAEGAVAGREVLSNDWDAAALTATATVSVPLYGLSGVVRLDGVPVEKPGNRRALEVRDPVKHEADLIVIDARETIFRPCLMPVLVDMKEQCLFDASDMAPEALAHRHLAVCVRGRQADTSRPATSPAGASTGGAIARRIELKATVPPESTRRPSNAFLYLDESQIAELSRHADALELLKAGRLVIVLHP